VALDLNLDLTTAQAEFIADTTTPNLLFCGGYGSGKSFAGSLKAVLFSLQQPGYTGIVASPTYSLARNTVVKAISALLEDVFQIKYHLNKSELRFTIPYGNDVSEIQVLSVDSYSKLVGINAAWFVFDEMDILSAEHAKEAWAKLSARVRVGDIRQRCATTTPEGLRFAHEYWIRDVEEKPELAKDRRIIKASTADSPFVTDDYIQKNILQNFPRHIADAYIKGDFVNFNTGSVYLQYDRAKNGSPLTLKDLPENRPLVVGMDFNRNGMSGIVLGQFGEPKYDIYGRAIGDEDKFVVVDEVIGQRDTPEMIGVLKSRYPNRRLIICPDATGERGTGRTDIALLQDAGFEVKAKLTNPLIRDRVSSVNALFCNGADQRRLFVNTERAPLLARCLEQQAYDKHGAPTKGQKISQGAQTLIDGPLDALGYAIWQFKPLVPRATVTVS